MFRIFKFMEIKKIEKNVRLSQLIDRLIIGGNQTVTDVSD